MLASKATCSYVTQCSISSVESNDNEMTSSIDMKQYGPIQVRVCKKSAPTLENGRRSKNLILVGEEAIKREKRRVRNRDAARKLKEKRQLIEDELSQNVKQLENEHLNLKIHLEQLEQQKQNLQDKINNLRIDPIIEFLSNDEFDLATFLQQHSNDFDLFDESIEEILNLNLNSVDNN